MARTRGGARKRVRPRLILVVSLLVQNATAVRPEETTAEPAPGPLPTRAHRRRHRRLAGATAAVLPVEILVWEIFVRLPAKHVLRCRAVCHYWYSLTSSREFIIAHHRRQTPLLLLKLDGPSTNPSYNRGPNSPVLYGTASTDPILEDELISTPDFVGRRRGYPVLGFDDYNDFHIHASCDGLLLLSSSSGRFIICNPATRQCAPLPCLTTAATSCMALYLHRLSGEYRILYRNNLEDAYYIHDEEWRGRSPRRIGAVPSDNPRVEEAMLALNEETSTTDYLAPPVVFRNCLHWAPSSDDAADILIFDTIVESFRLMHRPADATTLCTRLCHMEGSIGFSCLGSGKTIVKIWVLEDYQREVWSFKYRVELPVGFLCDFQDTQHLVMSDKGDVLVYDPSYGHMFHCDNTGKLLEEFRCDPQSVSLIGPWFKESLVKHDLFLRQGCDWAKKLCFF